MAKFYNHKGEWLVSLKKDSVVTTTTESLATDFPDTNIVFDILEVLNKHKEEWRME